MTTQARRTAAALALAVAGLIALVACEGSGAEQCRPLAAAAKAAAHEQAADPGHKIPKPKKPKKPKKTQPTKEDRDFANKVRIQNPGHVAVQCRKLPVTEYVAKYRRGSVMGKLPSYMKDGKYTVEEALLTNDPTVRKLLTDGRFAKK